MEWPRRRSNGSETYRRFVVVEVVLDGRLLILWNWKQIGEATTGREDVWWTCALSKWNICCLFRIGSKNRRPILHLSGSNGCDILVPIYQPIQARRNERQTHRTVVRERNCESTLVTNDEARVSKTRISLVSDDQIADTKA